MSLLFARRVLASGRNNINQLRMMSSQGGSVTGFRKSRAEQEIRAWLSKNQNTPASGGMSENALNDIHRECEQTGCDFVVAQRRLAAEMVRQSITKEELLTRYNKLSKDEQFYGQLS